MGFEKLLLATDGSESAEAAVQEALNIAKVCSSRLYVISVVEVNPEYEALAPQIVEKARPATNPRTRLRVQAAPRPRATTHARRTRVSSTQPPSQV